MLRAAIAAAVAASLLAGVQTYRMKMVSAQRTLDVVQLRACGARLDNLIKDLKSDAQIDNIPDDALSDVPDHWLLPRG